MKLWHQIAERYSRDNWLPPWTISEHNSRYCFVSKFVPDKILIDLACGGGVGAGYFVRVNPRKIYGFDVDEKSILICRERFGGDERLEFNVADGLQIPLANEFADLFISLETIEHIQEDQGFIREVARTLKPNGIFICSTPNRLRTNPSSRITDKPWNPYHVREYSPNELIRLINTQFQIESVYGQNPASEHYLRIINSIANVFGRPIAIQLNKFFKLRWLLFRNTRRHEVLQADNIHRYEYMILVCKKVAV